jgi:two-component system response regulator MprA
MEMVLIVDDDPRLLKMLRRTLAYEGLHILTAENGREAIEQASRHAPDVIILDWMMPEMDGLEVIHRLRARDNKALILMLTARDAIENRVEGLESGADDYLVKPFAPAELVARIHALLRRSQTADEKKPLSFADLHLDPVTRQVWRDEDQFDLTPTEFDLLHFLMRHPEQVLEREQILSSVWGYDFSGDDNVIEVYVGYLRKKIEAGGRPRLIQTIRGVGYVLREG